eukprot:581068-Pyramimonas_sp.AAC.1
MADGNAPRRSPPDHSIYKRCVERDDWKRSLIPQSHGCAACKDVFDERASPDVLLATLSLGIGRLKTDVASMDSGVPVYMATASASIQWWMCRYTFSVAPQVACAIGNSLLVERVLHSAEPRTLHVGSTIGNSFLVALVL